MKPLRVACLPFFIALAVPAVAGEPLALHPSREVTSPPYEGDVGLRLVRDGDSR